MLKIIVPTCGAECLDVMLRGLATMPAFGRYQIELVVVYNENRLERRGRVGQVLQACWPAIRVACFPRRIGYVRAVDWGWKLAEPAPDDYVAVLNDDVVIEGDWITPLVGLLDDNPLAQVGPSVRRLGEDGLGYTLSPGGACHYWYLEGWCWMAKAETIARAGGIVDLGLEGTYCEDCDLSIRIHESGVGSGQCRVIGLPDLPIRHIGHGSSTPEMMISWEKNRKYLAEKWDLVNGGRRISEKSPLWG